MKIDYYRRKDFTSLSVVADNILNLLKNKYEINEQIVGSSIDVERNDVGLVYGMPRDVLYLRRNKKRYAGLVCETHLSDKEISLIKDSDLDEIWLPSRFCEKFYNEAGFTNTRIVPHGIDPLPIGKCLEDNILMVYASYSSKTWSTLRKNPFKSIEAAQRFDKKIILRTTPQKYYNKVGLNGVEFVEYQENLDDLYDRCSCVLCPSDSEGFGIIGLEALARGIPLISTKTGNDYLDDMCYIHIDLPVTTDKIYDALDELYGNWQMYSERAIAQREHIINKYSWDNIELGELNGSR
mgnify:CR=1 FL=1